MKLLKIFMVIILIFCANISHASLLNRIVPDEGVGAGIALGYIFPSLKEVNDHAEKMGLDKMDSGIILWGGNFRHAFSKKFQIGYYGAIGKTCSKKVFDDSTVKSLELGLDMHLATVVYKFYPKDWEVLVGMDAGYFRSRLEKKVSSSTYHFDEGNPNSEYYTFQSELSGGNIGGAIFAGTKYRFNALFAIGANMGYQYAKIDPKQAGEKIDDAPEVDLSGLRFRISADFHY